MISPELEKRLERIVELKAQREAIDRDIMELMGERPWSGKAAKELALPSLKPAGGGWP